MSEIIYFVDMDETLLHSCYEIDYFPPTEIAKKGWDEIKKWKQSLTEEDCDKLAKDNGWSVLFMPNCEEKFYSKKRPNAEKFLSELKELGKVYLCTNAEEGYARLALTHFKLIDFFDKLYFRRTMRLGNVPIHEDLNYFLIDDLWYNNPTLMSKFEAINGGESWSKDYKKNHIKIPPFHGEDEDVVLNYFIKKVKERSIGR